jgi:hypothetical protein
MRTNEKEHLPVRSHLGGKSAHPLDGEVGIILLGDSLVVPGTLFGIGRAGNDQADRSAYQVRDQFTAITVKDRTTTLD